MATRLTSCQVSWRSSGRAPEANSGPELVLRAGQHSQDPSRVGFIGRFADHLAV